MGRFAPEQIKRCCRLSDKRFCALYYRSVEWNLYGRATIDALLNGPTSYQPVLFERTIPAQLAATVRSFRRSRHSALIVPIGMKTVCPFEVGTAVPTQKTAVIRLTGINARGLC